jgi:UDP-N-acetylmuramoyl-tripeptide--D-alanyl-D-alanine ligase
VRSRSRATFIAVTGSSGKSTTTALISHILTGVAPVRAQAVENGHIAHVRSLQNTLPGNSYFVGEIAADGPGRLRPMIDLIKPSVGIVTLVALEHKSGFRKVERVAEEKQRLVEALPASGLAILNCDDPRVAAMAEHTKARTVTFGQTGGEYVVSNIHCDEPERLDLTITHHDQAFEITSRLTGAHQSLAVSAAFSCAHQLGVPAALIVERIASFSPVYGRCSVHRVQNGPVFIMDTAKAPYHSIHLALDMLAKFSAPRKRTVIGQISDASGSDRVYRDVYRAARSVADQVIFIGEHSHRSKATAEDVADGRFVRFGNLRDVAEFLKQSAIPDEIILLKSSTRLHLERLMLTFFTPVRCWKDVCGKKETCAPIFGHGCALYEVPFELHKKFKSKKMRIDLPIYQ